MLRLGILGLGEGRSAMSAALNSGEYELKTICDLREAMCLERAEEFNFPHYTLRYEDMLEDPEIDIIAIYTPDKLHAAHVKAALSHGKHVVCTKPFIDDLSTARELIELSGQTGKRVFVGQSSRFFEPMKRQRADYEQGLIGDIITVEAYYHADHRWFLEKGWSLESAFKWLYGGLSHPVDLVRWYLPEIEEVMGYGMLSANGARGGLHHEDTMHFIFKDPGGRIARVSGAYTGPVQPAIRDSEMSCILRCTEGCSQADYMDLRYAVTDRTGEESVITWEHKLRHYFRFEGKSHHAGEYQNYLEYFAQCIREDRTAYPDVREGVGTVALLKAMEQSLGTGKPVRVADILNSYGL
jgi:predicted dehydrogenase